MSKRQKYPQQTSNKHKQVKKEPCGNGWHCSDILNNKCSYIHDEQDIKCAKKLDIIRQQKQTIIILDTYDKSLSPICLLYPSLPIHVLNQKEMKMEADKYYSAILLDIQKPNSIDFKILKEIGPFGKWQIQQELLNKYFPKEYELQKGQKQSKMGQVKINGQLKKVVTIHQGKKIYFQKVNKSCIYPLLAGCKVSYYQRGNTICVTKVNYPREIKLCGIVQIDNNSQFYFISRNQQYDDMNPFVIPKQIQEKLVQFKGLFPYSLLKYEPIEKDKQTRINDVLKQYLVKGRFISWPLTSRFPIIQLVDQINVKNFKSLKDGIIYQAGITMTPFDKKEKQDSQKIVKKFKVEDYQKTRKRVSEAIFSIDNKQTKCHDDAISIIPLQNGSYLVDIHIADVAAFIEEDDSIDKKIKKRDETIYIKNYYQPMLYEPLKNLLSLNEDEDKLAFTLSFKVNSQGYIDYRTVQFNKNIINVAQNLAHQRLERGQEKYDQLVQLNCLFDKSKLIDNNYILESQTNSEVAMSRIIFISSIIPTYLLEVNIERAKIFKEEFQAYLKKNLDLRKTDMQKWQKVLDNLKLFQSNESKYKKELKNVQKTIDGELDKERKIIMKRLKQQKSNKKRQIGSKLVSGLGKSQNEEQFIQSDWSELVQQLIQADQQRQRIEDQLDEKQEKLLEMQKEEKQERSNVLKQLKQLNLQQSSSQQDKSYDQQDDDNFQNEQFRFNAAVGGKKFLQKIFKHPFFNIDIKWTFEGINDAFKIILSKDKGKLYQEYFKRVQVMNRQHFKYIIKMEKQKNADKEDHKKKQSKEDRSKKDNRQRRFEGKKNKQQTDIKNVDESSSQIKVFQETAQPQNIKKEEVKRQKIEKKQPRFEKKIRNQQKGEKEPKHQKKQTKQKLQLNEKNNNSIIEKQDKDKEKKQLDQKRQKISKLVNKQMEQQMRLKIQQKEEYYLNKYQKAFKSGEKIQFSQDQQEKQQQDIQIKSARKQSKRKLILLLLKKVAKKQEQEQKQKQEIKMENQKGRKLQIIVKNIKEYMQKKSQQYIQKYQQQYIKDSRLKNLDISFNENDKKIIGDFEKAKYKRQKIIRLKHIFKIHNKKARQQKVKATKQLKRQQQSQVKQQQKQKVAISQQILLKNLQKQNNQYRSQLKQQKIDVFIEKQSQAVQKEKKKPVQEVIPNQGMKQEGSKKLSKKQIKKRVEMQIQPLLKQLNQKYKGQKQNLILKIQQLRLKIKEQKDLLVEDLQSLHFEYNLLKLLANQDECDQLEQKKAVKKKRKQKKKEKKVAKQTILSQFLKNFKHYASKAGFKFKQMKLAELDEHLNKHFKIKKICQDDNEIKRINSKASLKGQKQQSLLKWNNPIRSYESLKVMRMIKHYKWLFEGQIYPTDIVQYYSDIKQVEKQMKQLQSYRLKKVEKGQLNKKVKQSNRQISKLQFYNLLKRDLDATFDFLNIGSPCPEKVKFVFHPILEEVEVNNLNFKQEIYRQVKGKVIIVRQFPLKFKVNLLK